MKKLILGMIISLTAVALAGALVPQYINYQGILRDSAGNLEDGTFSMIFKIYDAETSGTAVFNAAGNTTTVSVSNGLYNVRLGPVDSSVFDGSDLWLEVTVGSDTLSPRLRINSVAYAITADLAETANYAAVSGTATDAANAYTVDNLSANSSPTGGELYPLDSDGKLSGVPVSAEASGSDFALFIKGRLGAVTGEGFCFGKGVVTGTGTTITNSAVTAKSLIFLSILDSDDGSEEPIKVSSINGPANQFTVKALDGATGVAIPFCYLIIN